MNAESGRIDLPEEIKERLKAFDEHRAELERHSDSDYTEYTEEELASMDEDMEMSCADVPSAG